MAEGRPIKRVTSAKRRFAMFAALCFVWLGAVPALQWAFGVPSLDFTAMAARASERTGVIWTSSLVDAVRLAIEEPGLWLLVIGSAAPTLAALSILVFAFDREAWRGFIRRFHPTGAVRLGKGEAVATYSAVVCSIVVCLFVVFELREFVDGGAHSRTLVLEPWNLATAIVLIGLLDQGALLEEPGWRGYATPLLQNAGAHPLTAAVVVGAVWGLWHVPRDVVSGVVERLGTAQYVALFLPTFVLGTIAASIIASIAMVRLGGSVVPAIVVHGLTNDSIGIGGAASIEQALTPYHQLTKAVPLTLLAAILSMTLGAGPAKRTVRQPHPSD